MLIRRAGRARCQRNVATTTSTLPTQAPARVAAAGSLAGPLAWSAIPFSATAATRYINTRQYKSHPRYWNRAALPHLSQRAFATDAQAPPSAKQNPAPTRTEINNDLAGEKEAIKAKIAEYTVEELKAAAKECSDARRTLKIADLPAETLLKAAFHHASRSELGSAYVAFSDYWERQRPTVEEYNVIFAFLGAGANYADLLRVYNNFRDTGVQGNEMTFKILLKSFSESGNIKLCVQAYELMFTAGHIPDITCLESIVKAAAISGDPRTFHRFYERLKRKGARPDNSILKSLMDSWASHKHKPAEPLKLNDFSACVDYATRVHNYQLAVRLIEESRDTWGLQPDAFMYERLVNAAIRDGYIRHIGRAWLKKLKRYPKQIERREDHFEFTDYMHRELLPAIIADHGGNKDAVKHAVPLASTPVIKNNRVSRKESMRLYKHYPKVRYTSEWENMEKLDWVPEYRDRLQKAPQVEKQRMQTLFLRDIQFAAAQEAKVSAEFEELKRQAKDRWRAEQTAAHVHTEANKGAASPPPAK